MATHWVDHARRRAIVAGGFGIGVAGVVVAVVAGSGSVRDLAAAVAAVAVTTGVRYLYHAVRGGQEERFVVEQDGLSYTNRSGTRHWRWEELAYVRVHRPRFPGPGGEFLGTQVRAMIRTRAGAALPITGLTTEHDALIAAVRAHCDPEPPITVRERLRWLGLTVAAVAGIGLLVLYAGLSRRVVDYSGDQVTVVRPGLGATGIVLVLTGFMVCLVLAVVGVVKAVRRR